MVARAKFIGALCLVAGALACGGSDAGPAIEPLGTYVTGIHPNEAAVGDFDGDGDLDVAVPGVLSPQIATLWNDEGDLVYSLDTPVANGAVGALAYDIDGDGTDELLLSNFDWPFIQVLSGSTGSWVLVQEIELEAAETMAAGDLDNDGDRDLAVSRFREGDIALFFNQGGSNLPEPILVDVGAGPQPVAILEGVRPTIAVGDAASDSVALLEGTGQAWEVKARIDTPAWPTTLQWIDLDGDGLVELVGTANIGDALFVTDRELTRLDVTPAGDGCFGIAAIGDGRIAVTNKSEDTLQIFGYQGGAFAELSRAAVRPGPSPVLAVDLVGDETPELVVVDAFADSVSIYALP